MIILETHSHQGIYKMPSTSVHQLLDNKLIIFLRSWGSQDYNQKFIEEISHFLSTAQADIEVTSPFEYIETLTSLANKVRIAMLLAHDYFYKVENKTSFSVGFEAAVLMQFKNEISWASVGRFDVGKLTDQGLRVISASGSDRDRHVLLPIELLGVEKDIELRVGSFTLTNEPLMISSLYNNFMLIKKSDKNDENLQNGKIEFNDPEGTYWLSKIKSE